MTTPRQVLIGELGNAMQAYQRSTQAFDDEVGRHLGLNPVDLRCLDWLVDSVRTATELSDSTGLSSAATTAMIDRLEKKGFVRRVRSERDRRQVIVEMTGEGREQTWAFYGPLVTEGHAVLEKMTKADLALMLRHLVSIREMTDRQRDRLRQSR